LSVKTVGVINADGILPGKIGVETYEIKNNTDGSRTRLAGVGPLKKDGHWTYFNTDNSASLEDCLKLKNGKYVLFTNDPKHYEIVSHVAPMPYPCLISTRLACLGGRAPLGAPPLAIERASARCFACVRIVMQ
jgi:hypothetical protein